MTEPLKHDNNVSNGAGAGEPQPIIIQTAAPHPARGWLTRLLLIGLTVSLVLNLSMYSSYREYFTSGGTVTERFHAGESTADDKIAVIRIRGTIMPPFTERILKAVQRAKDDAKVKGVVLVIDSPGGLVADSHEIYHRLVELRKDKPIFVSMKRLAASGGYYVAMAAGEQGKIYAEPTTWTGSIGVIIPRYDMTKLSEKFGVASQPLKTGPYKDALSPFRELSNDERSLWESIMNDSFERFLTVIADNRKDLDYEAVRKLATGQIYTADDALAKRMVDAIGYEDEAIEGLKQHLGLEQARVVRYDFRRDLTQLLIGSAEAKQPENYWQSLLDLTAPQAMYLCSWLPGIVLQEDGF
jgi:protease IV